MARHKVPAHEIFANLISRKWEYPGATDIPGIPAGSTEDGLNYFLFLYELKMELGFYAEGASLSIAAPAGYWYLKNFPIEAIAVEVVS